MKFTYNSLFALNTDLNLISGIPGDVFSAFYVKTILTVRAKLVELNKVINETEGIKEYMDFINKEVAKRYKMKGNKKTRKMLTDEVVNSLRDTEMEEAKEEAQEKAMNEEFDLELPTLSIKDLPANFTGSQRLVIHELIK